MKRSNEMGRSMEIERGGEMKKSIEMGRSMEIERGGDEEE